MAALVTLGKIDKMNITQKPLMVTNTDVVLSISSIFSKKYFVLKKVTFYYMMLSKGF